MAQLSGVEEDGTEVWECEICLKEYPTKKQAESCEAGHSTQPTKVRKN